MIHTTERPSRTEGCVDFCANYCASRNASKRHVNKGLFFFCQINSFMYLRSGPFFTLDTRDPFHSIQPPPHPSTLQNTHFTALSRTLYHSTTRSSLPTYHIFCVSHLHPFLLHLCDSLFRSTPLPTDKQKNLSFA